MTSPDVKRRATRAGAYVRISEDPLGLEQGVGRQTEDCEVTAERHGWTISKIYTENDTSAFKKRRISVGGGRHVWRVVRPEWDRMLADYEAGVIDGIIVYDLDRLARQPRDLEDLIDLVEHRRRPVIGVSGSIDLLTPDGRTMARVMVAMANKASEDTRRRVARQRLQAAKEGRIQASSRRFGWQPDGIRLVPEEARALRTMALRYIDGDSITAITRDLNEHGPRPVRAARWITSSVRQCLFNPRLAGIALYNGLLNKAAEGEREDTGPDSRGQNPDTWTLRDDSGDYVRGAWESILSLDEWSALVAEYDRRNTGDRVSGHGTRKHLLTGFLRCGKPQEDGQICNTRLVGKTIKTNARGDRHVVYVCPAKVHGGCGGTKRRAVVLESLIEDLLLRHLAEHAPHEQSEPDDDEPTNPAQAQLGEAEGRLRALRDGFATGSISKETFFATVPLIETEIKKHRAEVAKAARAQRAESPQQIISEFPDAAPERKRAILGDYLTAIIVHPSTTRGRTFDYDAIEPIWRESSD